MATALQDNPSETGIRELVERWADGARRGDLDAVMSCYTPDILAFDAIAALQFKGLDAYGRHWNTCLEYMKGGEMIMEIHDLGVSVDGDVGFAHYLSRCGCIDADGNTQVGWMRATVCCVRTAEGWRIAHEHYSLPFDPQTMKAMGDIEP